MSSQVPLNSPLRCKVAISDNTSFRYTSGCCVFSRKSLIGHCSRSRKSAKSASSSWLRGMRVMRSCWPFGGLFFERCEKIKRRQVCCEGELGRQKSAYRDVGEASCRCNTTAEHLPTTAPSPRLRAEMRRASPLAASLFTRTTLALRLLCFLAVFRDSNIHSQATHCCSRVESLATFAGSRSRVQKPGAASWPPFRTKKAKLPSPLVLFQA